MGFRSNLTPCINITWKWKSAIFFRFCCAVQNQSARITTECHDWKLGWKLSFFLLTSPQKGRQSGSWYQIIWKGNRGIRRFLRLL